VRGCLEWPLSASGRVRRSESAGFVVGIRIAVYYSSGDPLIRYDRRRFQLVTPSRVASGGVFIARDLEDRLNPGVAANRSHIVIRGIA
jgi:hypothetical protein